MQHWSRVSVSRSPVSFSFYYFLIKSDRWFARCRAKRARGPATANSHTTDAAAGEVCERLSSGLTSRTKNDRMHFAYIYAARRCGSRCKTTRNCISGRCCCVHPTIVGCCIKLAGANQACIIYFAKMAARRRRRIISRGNGFHLFARGARICERVATRWEKNQIESMTGSETARERKCIDSSRCVKNKNASSFSEHVISFAYTLLNSSTGQLRM